VANGDKSEYPGQRYRQALPHLRTERTLLNAMISEVIVAYS
jgi:hypothetical protein